MHIMLYGIIGFLSGITSRMLGIVKGLIRIPSLYLAGLPSKSAYGGMALTLLLSAVLVSQPLIFSSAVPTESVAVHARLLSGTADSIVYADLEMVMAPDIHIYRAESLFFKVVVLESAGLGPLELKLPPAVTFRNFDSTDADVMTGGQIIKLRFRRLSESWRFRGYIRYQACDSTRCFLPVKRAFAFSSDSADSGVGILPIFDDDLSVIATTSGDDTWRTMVRDFTVAGKTGGYQGVAAFTAFLDDPVSASGAGGFAGKNVWLVLLLVFVGGLALNLTPCVLPMVPVTLAILGAGGRNGRLRGLLLGSVYGGAMALAYGALGAVVIFSGTQFGVINSSPVFNLSIAAIFVVLALGMFDVIHIDFTRFRNGIRSESQGRGSLATAFFMGIVAALLAGACVAPAVISTILYAGTLYGDGMRSALLLPLLLGAGMGFPWLFAGAGLSFLPRPGAWMIKVRVILGILILALALWYGYGGVHMLTDAHRRAKTDETVPGDDVQWLTSLNEGLQTASALKKPLLIDFWATWCKNCLVMDKTTMKHPEVVRRLEGFVLVKFQAEDPSEAKTKAVLDYFGVIGMPSYVVLMPVMNFNKILFSDQVP